MTKDNKSKIQRQLELEQEGIEIGVKSYRDKVRETPVSEMPPGTALMHKAIEPLRKAITEFKKPARGSVRQHQLRKFLNNFDDYEVAYIIAKKLINTLTEVVPLQRTAIGLTRMLMNHYEYIKFKEENPNYLKAIEKNLDKRTAHPRHRKRVIMRAKRKAGIDDEDWNDVDRLHIGARLIEMFIETTGLIRRIQMPDSSYALEGTEKAKKWIDDQHARCELMNPTYFPMIVEPRDWTSPYDGGFLTDASSYRFKLVKTRNDEALEELEEANMEKVYNAINTLQKVPWRINKKVYEVMEEVWEAGGGIADIPERDHEEPLPPKPWGVLDDDEFEEYKKKHPDVVKGWKRRANAVYERRIGAKSKRFQMAQKLMIADKFKDEEVIYFVWTLDWRGRLYPVQANINPQADDTGKALLEFAEGKPLGEDGAYWLAIQLANKWGEDKVSFADRVKWVEDHEKDILLSAVDPLGVGKDFWTQADEPWEFLAACFEWHGYKTEGKDFVSHLPIAMDGTCNGLQNFSAMLNDEVGGSAVNLTPADKPQDVYQRVADRVEEKLAEQAEKGDEMAKIWKGKVDRGIAKRPVMTTPYGVTFLGMRDQILKELGDRNKDGRYLDCDDDFKAATYLAKILEDAIGEVVIASREAMDWLQEVAKIVSKYDLPIKWTTPVGYRVHQYYFKQNNKDIRTYWGTARVRVKLSVNIDTPELNKRKQVAGIAPNFVHSMDASHLMMTINKAREEGIKCFSMIHDSYGTHAADTGNLARILREAFVEQYSNHDVLQKFADEIEAQLPEGHEELPPVPSKGTLDLARVIESRYFFA